MAEAAVEDGSLQKFYCHMCNVQFQDASANFTCPHCSDGFVEELQETPDGNDEMADVEWEDSEADTLMTALPLDFIEERRTRSRSEGNRSGRRYANRARIVRPRTLTRLATSNLRQQIPLEHLLQDFVVNLGMNWATPQNMQVFLGHPGDYAWGREGLDAIVTQLLNQMDSTGPPPVSKEVIDALPIVEVTEEQVNVKLQCSVCWEDFQLRESVRQLPCLHIYHEPCIRPWLELHGTCPICRQNLVNNELSSDSNQDTGSGGGGSSNYNLLRLFQSRSSNSSNGSSSSSLDNQGARTRSRSQSDSNN
ncbi:E3 ubiquitin-protein ligase Iruka isoform X2 [Leptinotarsa decemlineata]|uniref:E3 ubiquitin-protein ligase Iruka isoform X2 n=1 Tax=Leptinotarsa decemlineata TaxID=7539 RepID=UPI003D30B61F